MDAVCHEHVAPHIARAVEALTLLQRKDGTRLVSHIERHTVRKDLIVKDDTLRNPQVKEDTCTTMKELN